MIKYSAGWITSIKQDKRQELVIKAITPNKVGEIFIGGGLILTGIVYLTIKSFKNGATAYLNAENKALINLGLMDEMPNSMLKRIKHNRE